MAKCKKTKMHWFVFERPGQTQNDYNQVQEDWTNPAETLRRKGSYTTRIPTEFVQANQVRGALGYDLKFKHDPGLALVTANWRVRIETDGDKILNLRGPAADPDGSQTELTFVAVQETD